MNVRSWRTENGAPVGVTRINQSSDGFLWIGNYQSLYRFDGLRFSRFTPENVDIWPGNTTAIASLRNGDVLVGSTDGILTWIQGDRTRQDRNCLGNRTANKIVTLPNGNVWIAAVAWKVGESGLALIDGHGCHFRKMGWGMPSAYRMRLWVSRDGTLWAQPDGALYFLEPGASRFHKVPISLDPKSFVLFDGDSRAFVMDGSQLRIFARSHTTGLVGRPSAIIDLGLKEDGIVSLARDREGTFWAALTNGGVAHFVLPRRGRRIIKHLYGEDDGLSSSLAAAVFVDRENNIWVGTDLGIDRLQRSYVAVLEETRHPSRNGFMAAPTSENGVILRETGKTSVINSNFRMFSFPDPRPRMGSVGICLDRGRRRSLRIATFEGLLKFRMGRSVFGETPPEWKDGAPAGCTYDDDGGLIALERNGRAFKLGSGWTTWRMPAPAPGAILNSVYNVPRRGWWFYYAGGELVNVSGGREYHYRRSISSLGGVQSIVGLGGGVLVGGRDTLALSIAGHLKTLTEEQVGQLGEMAGLTVFRNNQVWIGGANGIWRVSTKDLLDAFHDTHHRPRFLRVDRLGELGAVGSISLSGDHVFATSNRVWFVTRRGLIAVDPLRFEPNRIMPPVVVTALVSGDHTYRFPRMLTLRRGSRSIEIDYTATSLTTPETNRFRYRLVGIDADWTDAGVRRQAVYGKLPPGKYSFQVIASNDSGLWNPVGATVQIVVPPFWYETWLFYIAISATGIVLILTLYLMRIRRVAGRMRGLLEERVAERERIARELHDTLLQGFQGLMLRFRAVTTSEPLSGTVSRMLDEALDRAEQVLVDGRESVFELRLAGPSSSLEAAIAETADRFADRCEANFELVIEGTPRDVHPLVNAECSRIASEAVGNAFNHSQARTIKVRVSYGQRILRLRVRDDGIGMPEKGLSNVADRHFGLVGMHERAKRIQATLTIRSAVGVGTTVELTLPARLAYAPMRTGSKTLPISEGLGA